MGDGPADAGAAAGDERDPRGEGFGFGIRFSFASSSAQYSMRNFSASSMGAYRDTDSAPRMTLMALT